MDKTQLLEHLKVQRTTKVIPYVNCILVKWGNVKKKKSIGEGKYFKSLKSTKDL